MVQRKITVFHHTLKMVCFASQQQLESSWSSTPLCWLGIVFTWAILSVQPLARSQIKYQILGEMV